MTCASSVWFQLDVGSIYQEPRESPCHPLGQVFAFGFWLPMGHPLGTLIFSRLLKVESDLGGEAAGVKEGSFHFLGKTGTQEYQTLTWVSAGPVGVLNWKS